MLRRDPPTGVDLIYRPELVCKVSIGQVRVDIDLIFERLPRLALEHGNAVKYGRPLFLITVRWHLRCSLNRGKLLLWCEQLNPIIRLWGSILVILLLDRDLVSRADLDQLGNPVRQISELFMVLQQLHVSQ